jgi:hypothetical protein
MKEDQIQFLTLVGQPPARLTVEQTAWVLLKPLGNPPINGIKFFATADILDLIKNRLWLAKSTSIIRQHWHKKNARKNDRAENRSHSFRTKPTTMGG